MFLLRSAKQQDAKDVFEIARHLDTVNLPADPEHVDQIITHSIKSFSGAIEPSQREYLFVLEDTHTSRVVGTSMIHAQHGTKKAPHVFFHVRKDEHYSETLDKYFVHQCLRIGYNYNGPTEIGGLILLPQYRRHRDALGKQLSYVRFLFIAMHRNVFRNQVLSELLPPLEENGTSILWEHLGRRFTGLRYQEADLLSKNNKEFIRTLFPHELIYTALLPHAVQQVIGKVGPNTRGVEKMLRRIGFQYANQIDPFDGGPHFIANTGDISLIQQSRYGLLQPIATPPQDSYDALIAAELDNGEFRAIKTKAHWNEATKTITIPQDILGRLQRSTGQFVWAMPL